jgi:hypothetical protein
LAVAPASGLIDSAAVEAAIMAGRQLIQFLGLGIEFREDGQRPVLAENISYERYKKSSSKYTDEVKVIDVGGKFQKLTDLTDEEKSILAEFLHGASKASAHLTEGSGHKLDSPVFSQACVLILKLVSTALAIDLTKSLIRHESQGCQERRGLWFLPQGRPACSVHNWNVSSKRHAKPVALAILVTRGLHPNPLKATNSRLT